MNKSTPTSVIRFDEPNYLVKVQIITELLTVLSSQFNAINLRHFSIIIESVLSLSTAVTTLSVSRISSLSYRTVQRFYALKDVNWLLINLLLFKAFTFKADKKYLIAADETVKAKAGKQTYGLGLFYSSLAKQVIKSVSFLAMSIIDIEHETSYIIACKQVIADKDSLKEKTTKENKLSQNKSEAKPKGRPKGSKNKPKTEPKGVSYTVLKTLLGLVTSQLKVFLSNLQCFHLVLDGFYGHEDYLLLAFEHQLTIISKLKTNAHLILPFEGEQKGIGRPKTKGTKLDLDSIDSKFFIKTHKENESDVTTNIYQFQARTPKMMNQLLNVVVLVHFHNITKRQSRTVLFTNDLTLNADSIIKYYSLRFQTVRRCD